MKDYQKQLDHFLDYPEHAKQLEEYLQKFWLDKNELNAVWLKIKNTVYNSDFKILPDPVYNENFDTIIIKGGVVFAKADFEALKSCMKLTGDRYFIIVEDFDENNPPHTDGPPLRFKYSADISWNKMLSGADITNQVFIRPVRNYFVFGDSGKWGKYVGDDYKYPLDIIGFDKKYTKIFHDKFKIPKEDIQDLKEWVAFYGIKLPGLY